MADLTEWGKVLIELCTEREEERRKREQQSTLNEWNRATQSRVNRSTASW